MEENMKEVRFDLYCEKCKHHDLDSDEDPCNECLTTCAREYTKKPVNFEEE